MDNRDKKSSRHRRSMSYSPARRSVSPSRKSSHKSRHRSPSHSKKDTHTKSSYSSDRRTKSNKKSSKKEKRRQSSSSDSSDDEIKLLQTLELARVQQKKIAKSEKERIKSLETPEEKRLRRLQKKEAKERTRKAKMGWDNEYLHFTNDDNPYGDCNLLDTFVWNKKLDKEGLTDLSKEEIQRRSRAKMEENKYELEKVKKRRHEREEERTERDRITELQQREREAAQFTEFSKQEDVFQLEQARIRSHIRIQDGRAKPIDLLARYVSSEGDVTAVDMHEPYTHLTGLTLADLEDLLEDIKVYQQLENQNENQSYWNDLTTIVQDELRRLRQRDASSSQDTHRAGIHVSVAEDVSNIFKNKSVSELRKLQSSIESKLSGPTTGVDVGYWESLLSQLMAHQARARLRERHKHNLKKKLELLKAEQGVKEEYVVPAPESDADAQADVKTESEPKSEDEESNAANDMDDGHSWAITAYDTGRFSPKLLSVEDFEPGTVIVDDKEEEQRLVWARQKVVGKSAKAEASLSTEEKSMLKEAQRSMAGDEVQFSVEAQLDTKHYLWSEKYRPRKPRYFNRVHTGFEWNKYNQTHYDMDNPPPKIVQGYKFNIFFPDLIDKGKTPQYDLTPCDDNKDFALLKFTSGPPYEEIGFKIVNREWEYSYKRGFRCQFHNNIFQLWFHFKRYRYRR